MDKLVVKSMQDSKTKQTNMQTNKKPTKLSKENGRKCFAISILDSIFCSHGGTCIG